MSRAPVHVLPEPGGPCTKRYEPSTAFDEPAPSPRASRTARAPRRAAARGGAPSRGAGSARRPRARAREARERLPLQPRVPRPARDECWRERRVGELRPAPEPEHPRDVVERDDVAAPMPAPAGRAPRPPDRACAAAPGSGGRGRATSCPSPAPCRRARASRSTPRPRRAPPASLAALEVPPPDGLRLAAVVLEELASRPTTSGSGIGSATNVTTHGG